MTKIKAILHDWDDTIVNSFETYSSWYDDFANFHGLETPNIETVRINWGKTVPKLVQGVWPYLTDEQVVALFDSFVPSKRYLPIPFPGVKETIEQMHSLQIILGVQSSGLRISIRSAYKEGIDTNFKYHYFIHTQEDSKYHKPDPKVFEPSFKKLSLKQVHPEDILYVGDHILDYKAAKAADLKFVAVLTGVSTKEDFISHGMSEKDILGSFNDVMSYIDL